MLGVAYTGDLAVNVAGGLERGAVGLGNLDAVARADLDALLGWHGSSVFVYGLGNHGGEVTALTGDAQASNNIEAPAGVRLYEAWIQQNLEGPNLSVLAGLYDVNSEFDVLEEGAVFLNSSFGIGAEFGGSGLNGPSIFPVTSLGARIQWHPTHRWYAQAAVLDGVPGDPADPAATAVHFSAGDGALWVSEVGYLHHSSPEQERGQPGLGRDHVHEGIPWRLAVGAWQYTRNQETPDGGAAVRARPGLYVMGELRPYREQDEAQGLGLFARVGTADGRINRFGAYTGVGATYTGLLSRRDEDVLALGLAAAHDGSAWEMIAEEQGRAVSGGETTLELTYRAPLRPWLVVQPDVQLVLQPDSDRTVPHALLLSGRVEIGF